MTEQTTLRVPVRPGDHIRGASDAPFTLVEYGDYECPHCRAAYPIVEAVRARLGPQLRFCYRHFPLATIHPHAESAAQAAEAAGAQQRFWATHDQLYQTENALDAESLVKDAMVIGLDIVRFVKELAERVYQPVVREHFFGGVRSGVNGTPTFFINGLRYNGPHRVEAMVGVIQDAPLPVTHR